MYEEFDNFINVSTWYTRHACDEQRFHEALYQVVWSDKFNADDMAEYFRTKLKIALEDHESHFAKAVDRYCEDAWAISDFIKHNKIAKPSRL
jgi:hypothetical protein